MEAKVWRDVRSTRSNEDRSLEEKSHLPSQHKKYLHPAQELLVADPETVQVGDCWVVRIAKEKNRTVKAHEAVGKMRQNTTF